MIGKSGSRSLAGHLTGMAPFLLRGGWQCLREASDGMDASSMGKSILEIVPVIQCLFKSSVPGIRIFVVG